MRREGGVGGKVKGMRGGGEKGGEGEGEGNEGRKERGTNQQRGWKYNK
jgi:hypothetical protein